MANFDRTLLKQNYLPVVDYVLLRHDNKTILRLSILIVIQLIVELKNVTNNNLSGFYSISIVRLNKGGKAHDQKYVTINCGSILESSLTSDKILDLI